MISRMDMILKRYLITFNNTVFNFRKNTIFQCHKTYTCNNKIKIEMNRLAVIIFLILFACFFLSTEAISQLKRVRSEIIEINREHGFIVINQGRKDSVYVGSVLDVYRNAKKIGSAEVVKARDHVTAAEIIKVEPGVVVRVGDAVVLSKIRFPSTVKEMSYFRESARVVVNINADTKTVWFYLIDKLSDYGFIIISSNKVTGILTARKKLELSLGKEIWADIKSNTDYEAVLRVTAIPRGRGETYLTFSFDGNYNRGDKQQRFSIKPEDKVYREIKEIAKKVKGEAER